jgi:hypothetical protein
MAKTFAGRGPNRSKTFADVLIGLFSPAAAIFLYWRSHHSSNSKVLER